MRRAAKVDTNQAEIVKTCRLAGLSVQLLHTIGKGCPDLLVGGVDRRTGMELNLAVEVKLPGKEDCLTEDERAWHLTWRGARLVTSSADLILAYFGLL